jgi:hypothetical protein
MRECRETPWKLLFVLASFGGSFSKKSIIASRQPNHVKHLLSGLYDLLKYNFHLIRSPPGDPRVAHCSHFSVRIVSLFSFFSPLTGISARGPQGRSDMALRPDSNFLALGFPLSSLFRKGRPRTNCLLCAPPSLIQRQIPIHPVTRLGCKTRKSSWFHLKFFCLPFVLYR